MTFPDIVTLADDSRARADLNAWLAGQSAELHPCIHAANRLVIRQLKRAVAPQEQAPPTQHKETAESDDGVRQSVVGKRLPLDAAQVAVLTNSLRVTPSSFAITLPPSGLSTFDETILLRPAMILTWFARRFAWRYTRDRRPNTSSAIAQSGPISSAR